MDARRSRCPSYHWVTQYFLLEHLFVTHKQHAADGAYYKVTSKKFRTKMLLYVSFYQWRPMMAHGLGGPPVPGSLAVVRLRKGALSLSLPLVELFDPPYEKWETRLASFDEMVASRNPHLSVKVRLEATVRNAYDAAVYIGSAVADGGLGNFINHALDNSIAYKLWRQAMPSRTPDALSRYQKSYPHCDFPQVSAEIEDIGQVLSEGQCLFHAGLWPGGDTFTSDRPLSTSFCPQVALRNADHLGKGYDAGYIDLFVLRATSPRTRVFAYKRRGTLLGHENEVLFAAGADLSLVSTIVVNTNYPAGKWGLPDKRISVRVLGVDIT